jgi:hypothetical protein
MPTTKTIGIVEVAFFAARRIGVDGHDQIDLAADEIGGQGGQPIGATLRVTSFDRHILSLDIAGLAQALAKRSHRRCIGVGRRAAEPADHRHRHMLRTHGGWPATHYAGE